MDRYEATRQIKAREMGRWGDGENPQSKTIIIALTAHAFEADRCLALEAGCDDFVCKPFRESEIFEKMAQYLGVRYRYEDPALLGDEPRTMPGESTEKSDIHHLSSSIPSLKEALTHMPAQWVAKLHTAALSAREKEIWKLIEQIPSEKAALAEALVKKVQDFRLDQIIGLTSDD
jgi:CheY-like chemotaxis protein